MSLPSELLIDSVTVVVLLGLSAFFSGSETAIFALQEVELQEMELQGGRALRAAGLARRPYRTLVTLLLSNMITNVALATVATAALVRAMGPVGVGVAIPTVTIALLLFGEIVPKTIGLRARRRIAVVAAPPVDWLATVLGPLRLVLEKLAAWVSGPPAPLRLSRSELNTLMELGREEGVFTALESRMLMRVLRLGETPVARLVRPRVQVVGIPVDADWQEVVSTFERSGRSRLPVYEGSLDHVVGVLYLKDFLGADHRDRGKGIRALMREPYFVPQSKPADELFSEFQRRRVHLAVVVGEHGGMEGIVTLEDLLEELIGEVNDEGDVVEHRVETVADGVWRVHAGIELEELGEVVGRPLAEHFEAVTLAGMLEEELGRVPRAGDRLQRDGFLFHVLTARPNRPGLVEVSLEEGEE